MTRVRSRLLPAVCAPILPLLVVAAVVLGTASSASAHAGVVSTNPDQRSTVQTLPAELRLTFNEDMNRPSYVTLTAPDGEVVVDGEAAIEGVDVVQAIDADPGLAGTYRVDYRVISADGHPVEGAFEFDVASGDEVEQGAIAKVTSSTTWWVALVAVPWILLVVVLVVRARRRRTVA